jgi:hypothetical protein
MVDGAHATATEVMAGRTMGEDWLPPLPQPVKADRQEKTAITERQREIGENCF